MDWLEHIIQSCVVLMFSLLTADLNNNNTEFDLGGGGGGWVNTHNVVKPTSTWLWLSWVLTTKELLLDQRVCKCWSDGEEKNGTSDIT